MGRPRGLVVCVGIVIMIAALYVQQGGCYYGLEGIEPWGLPDRDARLYGGPHPVVAHPPCARWGRYARGGPTAHGKFEIGADDGCFEAALASVRTWGGVIEHPADSHAWAWFGLNRPPYHGGWVAADFLGGWTCRVEQGHYGHLARKGTWLYAFGASNLPTLTWGPSEAKVRLDDGFHSAEERRLLKGRRHWVIDGRMPRRLRAATPLPFRDLLIDIARSVSL